jgi:hypothetical protein
MVRRVGSIRSKDEELKSIHVCELFYRVVLDTTTTRNPVVCNQSLCNWHATGCRLQLSRSCLQL